MSNLRDYDETLDLSPLKWEEMTSYERAKVPVTASTRPPPNWSNMELRTPYTPSLARSVWDEKTSTEKVQIAKREALAKPVDTRKPFKGRLGQIPLPPLGTFDPLPERSSVDAPQRSSTPSKKKVQFEDASRAKGVRRKTKRGKTKRKKTKHRKYNLSKK